MSLMDDYERHQAAEASRLAYLAELDAEARRGHDDGAREFAAIARAKGYPTTRFAGTSVPGWIVNPIPHGNGWVEEEPGLVVLEDGTWQNYASTWVEPNGFGRLLGSSRFEHRVTGTAKLPYRGASEVRQCYVRALSRLARG